MGRPLMVTCESRDGATVQVEPNADEDAALVVVAARVSWLMEQRGYASLTFEVQDR